MKQNFNDQFLPLEIKPISKDVTISEWILRNKTEFEADLQKFGAILFRGFNVETVQHFDKVMSCFDNKPLPYMFRSSPRKEISENLKYIYLSTSHPKNRTIQMHNESSYSRIWGRKIVFCCIQPADSGGETPLADSRKVLNDIPPDLINKFNAKGVKYVRNLFPQIGMSWQEVFQTTDKSEVLDLCREYKIEIEFLNNGKSVISWKKPAIYKHPGSGQLTWFNHIYFFNKYSFYSEIGLELDEELPDEALPYNTYFGDGTPITIDEYKFVKNAYVKNTILFQYQKGDVLFLDNMLTAHGRTPYLGERLIATAILEGCSDSEIEQNEAFQD
jgi:hypothetical protein